QAPDVRVPGPAGLQDGAREGGPGVLVGRQAGRRRRGRDRLPREAAAELEALQAHGGAVVIQSQPLVKLAFTEEQEELRRSVRRFLESTSPLTEVRRQMGTVEGYDQAVWSRFANELGL